MVSEFLGDYPELAVFLAIALGYVIGGFRLAGFSLGPVTGSLIAGLLIGQFGHVPVSAMAKSFLFLLFLFGIGYSVGPQFLQSLRKGGLKPVLLVLVCALTGLIASVVMARILHLDQGFAAGMLSGGLTQSPAIGTATEAIGALGLPDAERERLVAHVAIADAICYVFGAVGTIWFLSSLAPRLLGIDLVAEAALLERELGVERPVPGLSSGYVPVVLRAFPVPEGSRIAGETVAEAEARAVAARLYILRLRRAGAIIEARPDIRIQPGDVLAIGGRVGAILSTIGAMAEVEDQELLDAPYLNYDVLVNGRDLVDRTLAQVAAQPWAHGIHLHGLTRGRQQVPLAAGMVIERGDILRIHGPRTIVEQALPRIGTVISPSSATDFVVLGLAIFLGGLIGAALRFTVAGVPVVIGTSVGALVAGLVVGHLRTSHPLFGRIPDAAIALMTALGLAAFVAMTGLHAGPIFVEALRSTGLGLVIGGLVVTFTPLLVGLAFGFWVLRMNPVLLLGGLSGALTMTPAMAALQNVAKSPVPVLGYTPAYPLAQILLTIWGSVIVSLSG